ncbi:MAG: carboxylating nicotinate-nucleotide diphosphorylase [Candidatus Pacebacteria bacterium]|nr:carboxylating nicotinate-nucleotide diphosphorylase [Candidatus Paceibacterota bacterium]
MLNPNTIRTICRAALTEDVGSGDVTTLSVVPPTLEVRGVLTTRESCVCAGLPVAEAVFRELDSSCHWEPQAEEGESCGPGRILGHVTGRARAVLTGERTALNFLQRLSGIATLTRQYVDAVGRHAVKILDTRKTTPGLRVLEKYAVTKGGGENHRFGLYDRVMIKDNHRLMASLEGPGGIRRAVKAARDVCPDLDVEVEADTLDDVEEALAAKADIILLDNMTDDEMRAAVEMAAGSCLLEASGNITLERVPDVAATGVDFISVGALTHSPPAIDIGLELKL